MALLLSSNSPIFRTTDFRNRNNSSNFNSNDLSMGLGSNASVCSVCAQAEPFLNITRVITFGQNSLASTGGAVRERGRCRRRKGGCARRGTSY